MDEKDTEKAFAEALVSLGEQNPKVVVLTRTLTGGEPARPFATRFPDRFFALEHGPSILVGIASGLALSEYVPFVCASSTELSGSYEALRSATGQPLANIKLVGTQAGLAGSEEAYATPLLDDIRVMRGLPDLMVLQPSDEVTTRAAVKFAACHLGPVYMRLSAQKRPAIHPNEQAFQSGRAILLKEGEKLALIGSGVTVHELLKAADQLSDLKPWVVDMHTLRPLDRALIRSLARTCRHLVTVEDHSTIGGLGTAVAEILAEEGYAGKMARLGPQSTYGESGDGPSLFEKHGISAERIVGKVRQWVK